MRILLMFILTCCSSQLFSATEQFSLDNGLKIVVREDHRAPVAVAMIWYNAGSADEHGGTTGVAHALEHLMFKGTPKFPLGVFSKTIAALGGQENAFTNNDYTGYYEKIAASSLPKSLELEADRMQNLLLDSTEFSKEIKVIQEERRMRTDNDPQSLTFERFLAAAHLAAPYHHPVIGWMTDLKQMTVEDARDWYHSYYSPNNATLVVVGDVKAADVLKLAKTYFGHIKPRPLPLRKPQVEPRALGYKQVEVHAPAQIPVIMLGYTVPTVKTASEKLAANPYALEILAGILAAGDSGRFNQRLIRGQEVASSADVYYNIYARYQTQFILYGSPSENHSVSELKQAMLKEIEQLKSEKITAHELNRVKTQIIAQKTFERDSIFGQAMEIGMLETIGLGWQTADQYIERLNRVTPEELQAAANLYFKADYLTEAHLIPDSKQKGQP